jgi:hypothetical protein
VVKGGGLRENHNTSKEALKIQMEGEFILRN